MASRGFLKGNQRKVFIVFLEACRAGEQSPGCFPAPSRLAIASGGMDSKGPKKERYLLPPRS